MKTKSQAQEIFMSSSGDISFLVARPPCHDQYTCHLDDDDCDLDFQVILWSFYKVPENFYVIFKHFKGRNTYVCN